MTTDLDPRRPGEDDLDRRFRAVRSDDAGDRDWDDVRRRAGVTPDRSSVRSAARRGWLAGALVATAALVGTMALALLWPFGESQRGGVLERALAAVDDGPVLHAVLRGEWGGTLVDLGTGSREPVHGENEVWYDSDRGLVHTIERLGDAVQHEQVYEPKEPPADIVALGREYRQALESGSARVAGDDVVDGERVTWITFHSEMLPDVADGKLHEWARQVAVSRESFKPVAIRETRDGKPGPGTVQRVRELEMLAAGEGDFTASEGGALGQTEFGEGREPISREEAPKALGRTPLWLGREHSGLSLAQVSRTTTSVGRTREIRLTGKLARAAEECSKLGGAAGGRCFRALGQHAISVRPDGVFRFERIVWEEEHVGVELFYGTLGDDPSTYREDLVPLWNRPHVAITEMTRRPPSVRGAGTYLPPEGSVFVGLAVSGRMGFLRVDGLYVSIEASSEELVLAAARALELMPR